MSTVSSEKHELLIWKLNVHIHTCLCVHAQTHTHTHTHTHTLTLKHKHTHTYIKPFEDHKPTGLKVDIANCFPSSIPKRNVPYVGMVYLATRRRARRAELLAKAHSSGAAKKAMSNTRYGENVMVERCSECNLVLEQYDDETVGLCVTVLATFIHREPTLATPMLLNMLQCVSR